MAVTLNEQTSLNGWIFGLSPFNYLSAERNRCNFSYNTGFVVRLRSCTDAVETGDGLVLRSEYKEKVSWPSFSDSIPNPSIKRLALIFTRPIYCYCVRPQDTSTRLDSSALQLLSLGGIYVLQWVTWLATVLTVLIHKQELDLPCIFSQDSCIL